MPELAKFVYIHERGLSVDGREFPWHVADFPITATRVDGVLWKIDITLLADEVGFDPRLEQERVEEVEVSRKE